MIKKKVQAKKATPKKKPGTIKKLDTRAADPVDIKDEEEAMEDMEEALNAIKGTVEVIDGEPLTPIVYMHPLTAEDLHMLVDEKYITVDELRKFLGLGPKPLTEITEVNSEDVESDSNYFVDEISL